MAFERQIIESKEFAEFYESLAESVRMKVKYVLNLMRTQKVVEANFVKKLKGTRFYELRIRVGDEYRVIMFTVENTNFAESATVILLNGFMKKDTKEYRKQVKKAENIIKLMGI